MTNTSEIRALALQHAVTLAVAEIAAVAVHSGPPVASEVIKSAELYTTFLVGGKL